MTRRQKRAGGVKLDVKRWLSYTAAGASLLATAQTAEADIVTVFVNERLDGTNASVDDDIYVGDMSTPATIFFEHSALSGGEGLATFNILDATTASVLGIQSGSYIYVQNVAQGAALSQLTSFVQLNGPSADIAYRSLAGSEFLAPGLGLIGFRFDIGSGFQYGWARVIMEGAPVNIFTVDEYAYATNSSDQVFAGVSAVPEPGSLGMLALGAVGLAAVRKRRKALANGSLQA